jgi:hypothetical protein
MSKSSAKQRAAQLMEWLPTVKKQPIKRKKTRNIETRFNIKNMK